MSSSNRLWTAGAAGAVVVLAAGGWFLGVQPQLAHADDATAAAAATDAQASVAQAKVAVLAKTAARQGALTAQADALAKSVPASLQPNTFSRRVNTVAALDGVRVESVSIGSATAYTVPASITAAAAAAAAAAAPAPVATPGATPSAAAAAPAAGVPAAPVLAVSDPLVTGANFTVIPVTIVVKGTASAGLQFVRDLQRDERLILVSGVSTAVDTADAAAVTTTLVASIYALKS